MQGKQIARVQSRGQQEDDEHVPLPHWQKQHCLRLSNGTSEVLWLDLISLYLLV